MNQILVSSFPGFVPIDLDEWWAQRFLANIDKLSWRSRLDLMLFASQEVRTEERLTEEKRSLLL